MSTLVIGDGHNKWWQLCSQIDGLIKKNGVTRVVLLGDLVNDWNSTARSELAEIRALHHWINDSAIRVDALVGNHDVYYLLDAHDHRPETEKIRECSPGHHYELRGEIKALFESLRRPLRMAATLRTGSNEWLLTHAGVTQTWYETHLADPSGLGFMDSSSSIASSTGNVVSSAANVANALNEMLSERNWDDLYSVGVERGGDAVPGPLWADRKELIDDPLKNVPQIVGHTPVDTVSVWKARDLDRSVWPLMFCDTISTMRYGSNIGDRSALLVNGEGMWKVFLDDPSRRELLMSADGLPTDHTATDGRPSAWQARKGSPRQNNTNPKTDPWSSDFTMDEWA